MVVTLVVVIIVLVAGRLELVELAEPVELIGGASLGSTGILKTSFKLKSLPCCPGLKQRPIANPAIASKNAMITNSACNFRN